MSHWADYFGTAVTILAGMLLGGLLVPLYKAALWRLKRLAEDQECVFRLEAAQINSHYRELDVKKRIRP